MNIQYLKFGLKIYADISSSIVLNSSFIFTTIEINDS